MRKREIWLVFSEECVFGEFLETIETLRSYRLFIRTEEESQKRCWVQVRCVLPPSTVLERFEAMKYKPVVSVGPFLDALPITFQEWQSGEINLAESISMRSEFWLHFEEKVKLGTYLTALDKLNNSRAKIVAKEENSLDKEGSGRVRTIRVRIRGFPTPPVVDYLVDIRPRPTLFIDPSNGLEISFQEWLAKKIIIHNGPSHDLEEE